MSVLIMGTLYCLLRVIFAARLPFRSPALSRVEGMRGRLATLSPKNFDFNATPGISGRQLIAHSNRKLYGIEPMQPEGGGGILSNEETTADDLNRALTVS